MVDKKVSKDMMESQFSGESTTGMNKSGQEDFPTEKMTLAARPTSKATKGDDFKGGSENSSGEA